MFEAKYSLACRIFAFLALACAVAAVALAIRELWLMVIGVIGLAMGHFYSWRQRDVSIRRNLILLLFMVLTAFLGGDILVSGLSDRLLLSRYLIYGLVLGSFDLIRLRNVLASLILGGLLLILINEVALSPWFLLFLIIFTVLALLAGAAGYIAIEAGQAVPVGESGWLPAARYWPGFIASALVISVIFFFLTPRVASSQIRQASWLPSRLDLSLSSPSLLPSRPGASVAPGILASPGITGGDNKGDYATLGYSGTAADKPVMYVRSRISSYWRGMTLNEYDGRGWLNSSPLPQMRQLDSGEFILPDSRARLPIETEYWQAYYLLTDQPNAVFTGYWPGKIYLPQETLHFLERGSMYRVLSPVPRLRPENLRNDSIVSTDSSNLILPPITERTAALAESIVKEARTDYDKAVSLESFLLANYPYRLNVGATPPDKDAADYFLFEQQAGDCSHFATAMAVMARYVGLPARVAAGYMPGYIDPLTGAHVVRAGDAHAWVEINFQRHGWVAFDPTPRADAAMGFASGRNWVYFGLEDFTGVKLADIVSPLASRWSLGSLSIPGGIWLIVPTTLIAMVLTVALYQYRKRRPHPEVEEYSRLEGEARKIMLGIYHKAIKILVKKGLPPRQQHQSPYEYANIISTRIRNGHETIQWLTRAASSAAYNPESFDPSIIHEARQKLSILKRDFASNQ